ncbi:cleavage and polyadenylation specificity factor, 73 kDa subunit [Dorcoceras hygrometricum]|uniref:Cleavage and polyadenylation specificity factor, 73 kDa subunit n=1 Tax=Dorcoceras hygrometricum TaxID=472368 RepID=A0A2Z7B1X1_9LAMI|nr:cleavage and polyadenylation specificity factor, 73 kDa subunit [Dorcoceras hygrometricum]
MHMPTKQSQGFFVQMSVLLQNLVKADLGESVKLHPQKVLNKKSVHTYMKKNLNVGPTGETSRISGATSEEHSTVDSLQKKASKTKKPEKAAVEKSKKKKENVVQIVKKQKGVVQQPVEARSQDAPAKSKSGTISDVDSCPLVKLKNGGAASKLKLIIESSDSESTLGAEEASTSGPEANVETTPIVEIEYDDGSAAADQEERVECSNHTDMKPVPNEGTIVVRSGSEQPTEQSKTSTGKSFHAPVQIKEINSVMHFLPKIDPTDKGKELLQCLARPNPLKEHYLMVEEIVRTIETVEERGVEEEHRAQGDEQQAPPEECQTQSNEHQDKNEPNLEAEQEIEQQAPIDSSHSSPSRGSSLSGHFSLYDEDSEEIQGPSPSVFQMVVYIGNRVENNCPTHGEGFTQDDPQQIIVSGPQANLDADIKLKEVQKVIVSLDSKVKSMDSRVVSLEFKVEALLNTQTFMKNDFGIYKRAFYEKFDALEANVTSSQTQLETSLVRQFTKHQLQISSDLDFVKLLLAELVSHLKEMGDDKKGKGPSKGPGPSIEKRRLL